MHQFIEFVLHHWELWLAFAVIVVLLLTFELHSKLTGLNNLSPQEAITLVNHNEAVIIDIRDNSNFTKGHIINAVNIPLPQLDSGLKKIEKYKDKPVILSYGVGQAHHKAARLLKQAGFSDLYNLKGGIASWQNAGLPLVKS